MTLAVVHHRAALEEFSDAAAYYDARRPHLGVEFFEEIERCIGIAASQPLLFPIVYKDVRRATARRFPYCVYFRAESTRIVVLAVFHGRRNPRIWKGRA